jgi:hypothetical protein
MINYAIISYLKGLIMINVPDLIRKMENNIAKVLKSEKTSTILYNQRESPTLIAGFPQRNTAKLFVPIQAEALRKLQEANNWVIERAKEAHGVPQFDLRAILYATISGEQGDAQAAAHSIGSIRVAKATSVPEINQIFAQDKRLLEEVALTLTSNFDEVPAEHIETLKELNSNNEKAIKHLSSMESQIYTICNLTEENHALLKQSKRAKYYFKAQLLDSNNQICCITNTPNKGVKITTHDGKKRWNGSKWIENTVDTNAPWPEWDLRGPNVTPSLGQQGQKLFFSAFNA